MLQQESPMRYQAYRSSYNTLLTVNLLFLLVLATLLMNRHKTYPSAILHHEVKSESVLCAIEQRSR